MLACTALVVVGAMARGTSLASLDRRALLYFSGGAAAVVGLSAAGLHYSNTRRNIAVRRCWYLYCHGSATAAVAVIAVVELLRCFAARTHL
jgi:hypothetical protein